MHKLSIRINSRNIKHLEQYTENIKQARNRSIGYLIHDRMQRHNGGDRHSATEKYHSNNRSLRPGDLINDKINF